MFRIPTIIVVPHLTVITLILCFFFVDAFVFPSVGVHVHRYQTLMVFSLIQKLQDCRTNCLEGDYTRTLYLSIGLLHAVEEILEDLEYDRECSSNCNGDGTGQWAHTLKSLLLLLMMININI